MSSLAIFSIYLVYGAIFLAIGVAVTSRHATFAKLKISGLFWLLALFAFLHAGHEWLELLRQLQFSLTPAALERVRVISLTLFFFSFFFLFLFGITLHASLEPRTRPYLILLLIFIVAVSFFVILLHRYSEPRLMLQLIEQDLRNLIGFPACLLVGTGFLFYGHRLRRVSVRGAGLLTGTGIAFIVYGAWSGLVPSGTLALLPVEIWRSLAALAVLLLLMRALDVFLVDREKVIGERLRAAADSERLSAVGRLAAGVAQEVNNPLASISLQLELLHKDPAAAGLPDKIRERLRIIERNVDKTARIARELLLFAGDREEQGVFERVDLRQIVAAAWQLAGDRTRNFQLYNRLYQPTPVQGVAIKLEELLLSLFLNAMEAMPEGGIIEVTGEQEAGRTVLRISDRGVGIPPDQINRVLEPFFTTKDIGKGLGLGLSVCHGIMMMHGGAIELAPRTEGPGTVVTLAFPNDLI